MSTVKVKAIEPFDGKNPGDVVTVTERQAQQLIGRGLAKMDGPVSNKMKVEHSNKARPSPAAGEAPLSSASPAAPASPQTTASLSGDGERAKRTYTRRVASSPSTTVGE